MALSEPFLPHAEPDKGHKKFHMSAWAVVSSGAVNCGAGSLNWTKQDAYCRRLDFLYLYSVL